MASAPFALPAAVAPVRAAAGSAEPASTAVVYCEGNFGAIDGKTANGLVRHSERYQIVAVIDSELAGLDAGDVLGDEPNGIPICRDLADAVSRTGQVPAHFIFGIAPSSGMLSTAERAVVLGAIGLGMDIVNGLHEFLNDDPEFAAARDAHGITILDIRRPREAKDLRLFDGRVSEVTCVRIAVLGTDCAIGKRTTATVLVAALNAAGITAVLVSTGQTGLIQGARYGIALDAVPSQFCAGEIEGSVLEAFFGEQPAVIVIEGQSALSHPAYLSSGFILRGGRPQGVILQHAPARTMRIDFDGEPMPTPASEIHLIETFADTKVIGLTINHEGLTDAELTASIASSEAETGLPVTDALARPAAELVTMVLRAFPELDPELVAVAT